MKTNPFGSGMSGTVNIGITYPGSASIVNFPILKPIGRPRSTSIRPKKEEVTDVDVVPPDPPEEFFPEPEEFIGEDIPIVVPSEVIVSVSEPNKRLAYGSNEKYAFLLKNSGV